MDSPMCFIAVLCMLGTYTNVFAADCAGPADIVFAVPGSFRIPGEEFFPFERFLIMIADHFVLDAENTNIGLIIYGREPVAVSYPQPSKTQAQINARITLLSQRGLYRDDLYGTPNVGSALILMRHMLRNPSGYPLIKPRNGVKQIGVLFTNGAAPRSQMDEILTTTRDIHADGVTMYVVGRQPIGREFTLIGSDPCKLFSMRSFIDGLPSLLPYLGSSLCTVLHPNITVTEQNCFPKFWQPSQNTPVMCPTLNGIFQDPYNCAYYYKCVLKNPIREPCPENMLFEDSIKTCNYKEAVSCYTMISCPKKSGLFPHPTDCSSYLNCFDNIAYIQKCPNKLRFDKNKKTCVDQRLVQCAVH